ncbi:MAG: DNA gyrase subunit A [Bacilli bacterium]|nr:DNA gyrase subunit A [Bacillota bacterium]MDY4858218.1 DNA gyrase subunit A [Bacilli bacterium]MDY5335922.1 DNA gyrase subunit A [Bacilli bacterium]
MGEDNNHERDRKVAVNIVGEMRKSFLDYSMSVIVARALPDVRDGLKPVHRRILYTLYEEGMTPDKKYQKSANAVGAVMGHYHPHGDSAIYESMVRMAQDFTYRHTLVDGHGNFGSIDGDGAAASRYTEARLAKISMELLRDLNKDTVDFSENYDGQRKEPVVLPSRFPNILVNGNMGIAVGMATNIPPHNLGEVIDGCVAYIDNPDITVTELMQYIKGPDFPTAGVILGNGGIKRAYESGRGAITIRGMATVEETHNKHRIVITELPYQVNKKALIQRIGELVRDKVIDGISNLSDESALEGIKIVIDVKKEANANVVLNNLYKHTQLQTSYGINFLMLVDGSPRTLGLREIIEKYIDHQKHVIYRRCQFDLKRYKDRLHILDGLKIALDNIDRVIKIIRESADDDEAKAGLMSNFALSEVQSQAILDMRLKRLTGLEKSKIEEEIAELEKLVKELEEILASEEKILEVIKTEMLEIKDKYADERRTHIDMTAIDYIEDESLIPVENVVITLTNKGYIKRLPADTYKTQNRGGMGVKGMATNEEDFVEHLINATSHDYILMFTNMGKVYRIKGYEIPEYSRQSKGLPIINLLSLDKDEKVTSLLKISNDDEYKCLVFATKNGLIKRTDISEFDSIRTNGKKFITLKDNDELVSVKKTTGNDEILMASSNGRMVRFNESAVRIMGRSASGVRGINLDGGILVGMEIVEPNEYVLVITENGYGKKTPVDEYRITNRGGKGVKTVNITEKNGSIVSFKTVDDSKDLMIITDSGIIIRLAVDKISTMSRVTQGVKLINLKEDSIVSSTSIVDREEVSDDNINGENIEKESE